MILLFINFGEIYVDQCLARFAEGLKGSSLALLLSLSLSSFGCSFPPSLPLAASQTLIQTLAAAARCNRNLRSTASLFRLFPSKLSPLRPFCWFLRSLKQNKSLLGLVLGIVAYSLSAEHPTALRSFQQFSSYLCH